MTEQIIIKKGRVRIKQDCAGGYTAECRISWWLPFWWDMGHTPYLDIAENHIKWLEDNFL